MPYLQDYQFVVLIASVSIMAAFGIYAYTTPPYPTGHKNKARRNKVNVRYFCTTHLNTVRKDKEFVVLKDSKCEICDKEKKA